MNGHCRSNTLTDAIVDNPIHAHAHTVARWPPVRLTAVTCPGLDRKPCKARRQDAMCDRCRDRVISAPPASKLFVTSNLVQAGALTRVHGAVKRLQRSHNTHTLAPR